MSNIIISPKYKLIIDEVKKLKSTLSELAFELDNLKFVICKNIEMEYMLELGNLEYMALKAEIKYRRNKRKLELIQASLNIKEQIDIKSISKQLDKEYESYNKRIEEIWNSFNDALVRRRSKSLSEIDAETMKILYRKIIKALHPDVNPKVTDEQLRLLQNAVEAYRDGDIEAIKLIYSMIEDEEINEEILSYDEYKSIRYELLDRIALFKDKIDYTKKVFPYSMKELLENPKELSKRKNEYKIQIKKYEEADEKVKSRIKELLSNNGGDKWLN